MTIGVLTCNPNCEFRVMRSYIDRISISGILGIPIITDNVFFFPHPVLPNEDYTLIFNPKFWAWSAGGYPLAMIVSEYYHTFTGDPTHYPVDYSLTWVRPDDLNGPSILNVPFGVATTPNYFPLPPQDRPYWRDFP